MDVIIVCHTEFGMVQNRKVIATKNPSGVIDGVASLVEVAGKYGAKITYAVCPETVVYFPKDIEGEIGLHIHPGWRPFEVEDIKYYVGDIYLRQHCKQSSDSSVLMDYPYDEQYQMIKCGKEHVIKIIGKVPQVFVAGRWSINNDTIKALIANGMTYDCSAMAHHKNGHYDWSKLSRMCMPYHPSENDYQSKGDLPLLVVPISQMIKGGSVNPEVARIYGLSWLKMCFAEYRMKNFPLFHICLHSPCMTDSYYIDVMDKLLGYIAKHDDVRFKYVSEISEYDG